MLVNIPHSLGRHVALLYLENIFKTVLVSFTGVKICVGFHYGNTQRLTESCFFMEKPGIEPATPGLQGIALIHYTTGAS